MQPIGPREERPDKHISSEATHYRAHSGLNQEQKVKKKVHKFRIITYKFPKILDFLTVSQPTELCGLCEKETTCHSSRGACPLERLSFGLDGLVCLASTKWMKEEFHLSSGSWALQGNCFLGRGLTLVQARSQA
jgi:hypothetical protein